MSTPNPLIPQGTFPGSRGKAHVRIAVFTILAVHFVLLSGLLILGCNKNETPGDQSSLTPPPIPPPDIAPPAVTLSNPPPLAPSNPPPFIDTNVPPPPPPIDTPVVREHTVVKGESFSTIAKKYGLGWKAVAAANPGVDSTKLKIGDKIKIPAAAPRATVGGDVAPAPTGDEKIYTVKNQDNLSKIAKAHGVTVKALRAANNLRTDQIKVGQKLKIPVKAAPAVDLAPPPGTPAPLPPTTPGLGAPAGQ